jgi:hypothetical protein
MPTDFYRKVPGLGQKRNDRLTYSILTAISSKIVSLGTYTAIPSFLPCFKNTVQVISLNVFLCSVFNKKSLLHRRLNMHPYLAKIWKGYDLEAIKLC